MKKLFYILLLISSLAVTVSSCTEEVVRPLDSDNSGGNTSSPKGS